jgi:hypothetical protein
MNDTVVVLLTLGGTFVLALAVDRGVPNGLESAAFMLKDIAGALVASLRHVAEKLRHRHAHIEAANRRRGSRSESTAVEMVAHAGSNAR